MYIKIDSDVVTILSKHIPWRYAEYRSRLAFFTEGFSVLDAIFQIIKGLLPYPISSDIYLLVGSLTPSILPFHRPY